MVDIFTKKSFKNPVTDSDPAAAEFANNPGKYKYYHPCNLVIMEVFLKINQRTSLVFIENN